jgi:hypothetical protein
MRRLRFPLNGLIVLGGAALGLAAFADNISLRSETSFQVHRSAPVRQARDACRVARGARVSSASEVALGETVCQAADAQQLYGDLG